MNRGAPLAVVASLVLAALPAKGDIVTSWGAGVKIPSSTSVVMLPDCHTVKINESDFTKGEGVEPRSCGGDNPVFIGWPIAWKKEGCMGMRAMSCKAGWFHLSHWFDGGSDRELHMDCACFEWEFNWSKRRGRN